MAIALQRIKLFKIVLQNYRTIMSSNSRMQKVMEDLQQNPYYEKYAIKITQMQKTSPDEFMDRIEKKHNEETQKESEQIARRYSSLMKPKEPPKAEASPAAKRLDDIFKVDLVNDKNADEIKEIWLKYHLQKDVIAATIPIETYNKIQERLKNYPTFLFPLPRSQGYEFILSQAIGNEVHFTTLLCFQIVSLNLMNSTKDSGVASLRSSLEHFQEVHKENAPECLTIVNYDELSEKGIVLMRGEYDKNVIDAKEAQCIANQFQMFYGQDHPKKLDLLEQFTKKPDVFKHMDLIAEMENIKIE